MSRREEILTASKRVIAEQGYSDTSMRDLAEASGLMAGSLYSHFRSKAALVGEIVTKFYDELIPTQTAVLAAGSSGADQLRAMIGAVYDVCAAHREELTILHYDWHALSMLDDLAEVHTRSRETLDLWQTAVDRGVADGSLRADLDGNAMVRIATSSIHGLLDTVRYTTHPVPADHDPRLAATLEQVLLAGVATEIPAMAAATSTQERST